MDKQKRYEATEKGKEARARAQATRQAKRKELAQIKRIHERSRRTLTAAKFSKRYTVHTVAGVKQAEKINTLANDPSNELSLKGTTVVAIERHYREELGNAECVQAGVPRWSESILNPAYVKKLNEDETLILRVRKVLARLHKLLERKSNQEKP